MKVLGAAGLVFFSLSAYPQKEPGRISKFEALVATEIAVNEGSITLNDGSQLKGLVGYNDMSGALKFEKGNDTRMLSARQVMAFEVYDPDFGGVRIFYTLQKEDLQSGALRPHFFELLVDFESFAVLSAQDPLEVKDQTLTILSHATSRKKKHKVEQVETFYLMKPGGVPEAYFSLIIKSKDRKPLVGDGVKSKKKYVDRDLLEEYMGDLFPKVEAYAKENKLSLKEKPDFLKILEFYQTLIN